MLFAMVMLMSCEHKDLVMPTGWGTARADVRVDVDWSLFGDEHPTGMTVVFFSTAQQQLQMQCTNDVYSLSTQLAPGVYHVGVVNQSPDELDTVEFVGVQTGSAPLIVGKSTTMPQFVPDEQRGSVCVEPQKIGYGCEYAVIVPDDADTTVVVNLSPNRIDYMVDIGVEVTGYSRIEKVYGVLTGMSDGYNAVAGEPIDSVADFGIADWSLSVLNAEKAQGVLTAELRTFGVTYAKTKRVHDVNLKLYLQLSGTTQISEYTFAVGSCFEKHENRRYSIYIDEPIEIPSVGGSTGNQPSTSGTSGFDATVNGWGDSTELDFE